MALVFGLKIMVGSVCIFRLTMKARPSCSYIKKRSVQPDLNFTQLNLSLFAFSRIKIGPALSGISFDELNLRLPYF